MNVWQGFKRWYLGPNVPEDYVSSLTRPWGIPWFREREHEYETHMRLKKTFEWVATLEPEKTRLDDTIAKWRRYAQAQRTRKSSTRDAGMDEYFWGQEAKLIDQILDDIEASR